MEFLTNLLENSTMPWVTAMVLGLMTAISPCPLATNITAVGFISKDLENRNRVFLNGILYTFGRAISYFGIAFFLFLGVDQLKFSGFFQQYGEKIIGPLLLIIGLFMLDILKIKFPGLSGLTSRMERKKRWGYLDVILLGIVFALAFCPYSGVLYFGMLIPMTISSASGLNSGAIMTSLKISATASATLWNAACWAPRRTSSCWRRSPRRASKTGAS